MPTLLVRNNTKGPAVFTDPVEKIEVSWAGSGDETGMDVRRVSDKLLDNAEFLKGIDNGIFEIVQDEAGAQEKLAQAGQAAQDKREQDAANIEAMMDRTAEQPIAVAVVDEAGKLTEPVVETERSSEPQPVEDFTPAPTDESGIPITVPGEPLTHDEDGKQIDTEVAVVMGPRERG